MRDGEIKFRDKMIACIDVYYNEENNTALGAMVLVNKFTDTEIFNSFTHRTEISSSYISGEFYKRELPVILKLLEKIKDVDLEYIVVDGYVNLSPTHHGLGHHLYESLGERIPVIGVAKTHYHEDIETSVRLLRGESRSPLYITSIGISQDIAAKYIKSMDGPYRIPKILKEVDKLSRC